MDPGNATGRGRHNPAAARTNIPATITKPIQGVHGRNTPMRSGYAAVASGGIRPSDHVFPESPACAMPRATGRRLWAAPVLGCPLCRRSPITGGRYRLIPVALRMVSA